ncbi:hypothetical protein MTR67_007191 [Solanum verrucosum]|uniref:Integrase zinc-binding domain-containing protein n=1 Tax=Solanum verrucosum TaxID=315347 RepID=A0AAF0TCI6_SOLVR|nr:hypothetical protein MTR67_007191 [Solanum verrucosum]
MVDFNVILVEVKGKQDNDPLLIQLKGVVYQQRVEVFSQEGDRVLCYQGRLCVPNVGELRQHILVETHKSRYSIHPGATKMYRDLWEVFWWNGIKRDITYFVAKWPICQQVKVEHQKLRGMTHEINIPTWKWEMINMDFIRGLPHTRRQHDSIRVIVDIVTKSMRFLAVKTTDSEEDCARLYINEIVRLHGVHLSIISDRDGEDMLKACVIDFKGPDSVHDGMEKVQLIRDRLKTAQSCQKSYADVTRKELEFQVDDWVFLKVPSMKGYDKVEFDDFLTFSEELVSILENDVWQLLSRAFLVDKVCWRHRQAEVSTWEIKLDIPEHFPGLLNP